MEKKFLQITLLSITACFVIAVIYFLYFFTYTQNQPVTSDNSLYTNLMNVNPAFLAGEQLFRENSMKEAIQEYERALPFAQSKPEEAQIRSRIAAAKAASGDVVGAIAISKEIVADENYGSVPRAYSVQAMGQIFYALPSAEGAAVTKEIFKDEPYKGFASTTDESVSYRNLFEYASSIYPLALPELRSAYWYADAVYALKQKPSLSVAEKERIQGYLRIVSERVVLADVDIVRVKTSTNESRVVLPGVFIRKALLNSRLSRAGETYSGMVSPESVYEDALSYVRLNSMTDSEATLQYSYAVYLMRQYGEDKGTEIKALLDDFHSSERFTDTAMMVFFRNEAGNDTVTNKNTRLLAGVDPEFKEFLQKLGWKF